MTLVQSLFKELPERDQDFLDWIIFLPCAKCGAVGWLDDNGKRQGIVAHHQPAKGHGAKGSKTSDRRALPLCCFTIRGKGCHEKFGEMGRDSFWGKRDIESLIIRINEVYDKCIKRG
jgi:hypothetical protein